MRIIFAWATFTGHFSICVWLFNRLHAQGWRRKVVKSLEKLLIVTAAIVATYLVFYWLVPAGSAAERAALNWITLVYSMLCWLGAAAAVPLWLIPKLREQTPAALLSNDTTCVDVGQRLGFRPTRGARANLLGRIPGNEILRLSVQRKVVRLPGLPPALDGLTIAHLSDLHMTGQLSREFYDVVIAETNALEPDLIVLTGDILEKAECLPWIEPTLGRLNAPHGKFFVLGNHEMRLADVRPLRSALVQAGWTDLGSRCERHSIRSTNVLMAGTELPWFGTSPDLESIAKGDNRVSEHGSHNDFRVLLSHSPDQLPWARANAFHLMLAGHNHGGQIRFPFVGALIAPSWYGSRFAGGLYHLPPTLLHVSRGIAGIHPIRLNCPPEIALLELRA